MIWEPRPVPRVSPETATFWKGCSEGKFLLCKCKDCGLIYYYPRLFCPDCLSDEVVWSEANGTGSVYSFTVSEKVKGWPTEALPLVLAYVELDEGPRVLTNIDCEPDEIAIGTTVEAQFVPTELDEIAIPVFVPA